MCDFNFQFRNENKTLKHLILLYIGILYDESYISSNIATSITLIYKLFVTNNVLSAFAA